MKDKHTPGPWKVDGTYIYEVEQDKIIAEVETYNNDELPYQANARLMAAAPELFEFVESLATFEIPSGYSPYKALYVLRGAISDARALLAKIEGDE